MTQKGKVVLAGLLILIGVFVAHHFVSKNKTQNSIETKSVDSSKTTNSNVDSLPRYNQEKLENNITPSNSNVKRNNSLEKVNKTTKKTQETKKPSKEEPKPKTTKSSDRENLDIKF